MKFQIGDIVISNFHCGLASNIGAIGKITDIHPSRPVYEIEIISHQLASKIGRKIAFTEKKLDMLNNRSCVSLLMKR